LGSAENFLGHSRESKSLSLKDCAKGEKEGKKKKTEVKRIRLTEPKKRNKKPSD